MDTILTAQDAARRRRGFQTAGETAALAESGVVVLDAFSTLISRGATFAPGVVLWPNVTIEVAADGAVLIGARTVLFPGVRIAALAGHVEIGADAEIGEEGGFTIRSDRAEDRVTIGDGARLLGGGSLLQTNRIGSGAQILGPIRAQACRLGDGDTYRGPDPDRRGGVLKGAGVARGLDVPQGEVVQAFGIFAEAVRRPQSYFHPKT